MRNVGSHLLEDKMDETVTHYINSHQSTETVHVDANSLAIQDDNGGRVLTVMHPLSFSATQMCRQMPVNDQVSEGQWNEELLESDERLAAIVAHLAQHSRLPHHPPNHHKVPGVRTDVDTSVILDSSLRLYNGQPMEEEHQPIVIQVPSHLPPLPQLQEMKRCQETDWFSDKTKTIKDDNPMLAEQDGSVLDIGAGASPVQNKQQSKKSLPHKKRISRKLKRNTGNSTPQQDIVVIHCNTEVSQEEILPDNFVNNVSHTEHMSGDTHHISQEVRPILICQLCGDFYGEEQLKFYQHLKQHYEPHGSIIIENPVPDLGIDKMTNTCIVDNVQTLPDSLVELSLESTVPKSMYQPMDKQLLYATSDKALSGSSNKAHFPADRELGRAELYDGLERLERLEVFSCVKCDKSFRKQKQCEAHVKEAHLNPKLEDMGEFSEPEDLMAGIHVAVEDGEPYEPALLPHLVVDNGHVHQDHVRHWYIRNGGGAACECGAPGYCAVCAAPAPAPGPGPAPGPAPAPPSAASHVPAAGHAPAPVYVSAPTQAPPPPPHAPPPPAALPAREHHSPQQLKEEVLQRIFDSDVSNQANANYNESIIPDNPEPIPPPEPPSEEPQSFPEGPGEKKKLKKFDCPLCARVFHHRNSLLYHMLMHGDKQHYCKECEKGFYTAAALKIHERVHSNDRPCPCDECGRCFRQWSDLKYHKASIHSVQKDFKCEFCSKEFARRYSLIVHRRIHTGERNYKCDFCSKTFRASSYRLSHMRTHTGSKPYKCTQCEKCFRVAYDLRRHMLTHEKLRQRVDEMKAKSEDTKNKKSPQKEIKESKPQPEQNVQKETSAKPTKRNASVRLPVLKSILDKKQPQRSKRTHAAKKGAPNVTVGPDKDTEFKNEYTNNVEVFDTRQTEYNKYKDEVLQPFKKDYNDVVTYKDNERLSEERDLAVLRPMFRSSPPMESLQKPTLRSENTDGKLQVFTHIEKNKMYNVPMNTSNLNTSLNEMRHLEKELSRDLRSDILVSENMDNSFIEKLSAFYNITAV